MDVADRAGRPAGNAWGDDISPERQAELEALFQRQAEWAAKPEAERGESTFKDIHLTGADVFWLAARTLASRSEAQAVAAHLQRLRRAQEDGALRAMLRLDGLHLEGVDLHAAHLERATLGRVHLEGANLYGAHLERAVLDEVHLSGADLGSAHLTGALLNGVHLQGANLYAAHLERAELLYEAHLERAYLVGAYLDYADLRAAHLERADLVGARLAGADLREAHLEGADLGRAHLGGRVYGPDEADFRRMQQLWADFPSTLPPADLRAAFLDSATTLNDTIFGTRGQGPVRGYARMADVRWGGVNLAVIKEWPREMMLGDEYDAWAWRTQKRGSETLETAAGRKRSRSERAAIRRQKDEVWKVQAAKASQERLERFRAAVRANRQLAMALRQQGMNEEADRFAYRAQVCQRRALRLQHHYVRVVGSWWLDRIAGYGYRPLRSLVTYLVVVGLFAVVYALLAHLRLTSELFQSWDSPLVLSVTSFHGRVFFAGGLPLDDWSARVGAVEAAIGLLIEITFIATFTNRFFAR